MSDFQKDNVALMCDIGELVGLFDFESGLDGFLAKAVSTVAWHMRAAVCSIYLYEAERQELLLKANQGLNPALVGKLRLKYGEGLTGLSLQRMQPICEANARENPAYKSIDGFGEDRVTSFLAVPMSRKLNPVGVISVQDPQYGYFNANDIKALKVISSQLAGVIENAHLLMKLRERGDGTDGSNGPHGTDGGTEMAAGTHVLPATGVSGGVATGLSARLGRYWELGGETVPEGLTEADFDRALEATERQLLGLQRRLESKLEDAASMIFGAHVLMLKDEAFAGEIRAAIRGGANPWAATVAEIRRYAEMFEKSPVPMVREKVMDVEDMGRRLLYNLGAGRVEGCVPDYAGQIVIAEDLLPSDLLKLSAEGAAGLVLLGTGRHSHVAILAKALDLPLVLGKDRRLLDVPENTPMLVDAKEGKIVVRPGEEALEAVRELVRELGEGEAAGGRECKAETWTADGTRISLMANLNLISELEVALRVKAEGVGLYRTEFPFVVRNSFPSEEEQYQGYRKVLERMGGLPVVFRTLDIGGDKALSYYPARHESNPFLGLRALRFSLRNPKIFKQQLRALLRAAYGYEKARILFPLVASLDEFWAAKELTLECRDELLREGTECRLPEIGVMIEIPSAVLMAEEFAREADFLSIGSNDLTQYLLAVDRTNVEVASYYSPHHPAVLRALNRIVEAIRPSGKPFGLCGNLAMDEAMLPFLLGIGIRRFSMDPRMIPELQERIGRIRLDEARWQAREMLGLSRISEVEAYFSRRDF